MDLERAFAALVDAETMRKGAEQLGVGDIVSIDNQDVGGSRDDLVHVGPIIEDRGATVVVDLYYSLGKEVEVSRDVVYRSRPFQKGSMRKGAPFAGYSDFDDCVAKNSDKDDPEAYCGSIKNQVEGSKTAQNPFVPSNNPFAPENLGPGTPDDVLDGPLNPPDDQIEITEPMTTKPRQMPNEGDAGAVEEPPIASLRGVSIPVVCMKCNRRYSLLRVTSDMTCLCGSNDLDLDHKLSLDMEPLNAEVPASGGLNDDPPMARVDEFQPQLGLLPENAEFSEPFDDVSEEIEAEARKTHALSVPSTYQIFDAGGEIWGPEVHETIDWLAFHWGQTRVYALPDMKVAVVPWSERESFEADHPEAEIAMSISSGASRKKAHIWDRSGYNIVAPGLPVPHGKYTVESQSDTHLLLAGPYDEMFVVEKEGIPVSRHERLTGETMLVAEIGGKVKTASAFDPITMVLDHGPHDSPRYQVVRWNETLGTPGNTLFETDDPDEADTVSEEWAEKIVRGEASKVMEIAGSIQEANPEIGPATAQALAERVIETYPQVIVR